MKDLNGGELSIRLRRQLHRVSDGPACCRYILSDAPKSESETVITVDYDEGRRPAALSIERKAHSYFPVYLWIGEGGALVVSDTMGFMHDVHGGDDAQLRPDAQRDHLVFGRPPSTGMLRSVEVVDFGERVVVERDDGRWQIAGREQFDRLEHGARRHWREGLAEFEGALRDSLEAISPTAVLFSGGVDSTLLQALCDGELAMVTGRVPDREFAPEVERARKMASLFSQDHRVVDVDESDFVDRLIDVTQRTGLPCPAMQHVVQTCAAAAIDGDAACYGELGDGTYGFPVVEEPGVRDWFEQWEGRPSSAASRRFSVASIRDEDASFGADIEAVYGSIGAAHHRRSQRVGGLLDWAPELASQARRWERFVACGHATDLITVGCIKSVRDVASSTGTVLHTPLMRRSVLDCFHQFDPATRYRDEGQTKPVLKTLLSQQVPNYGVERPKLASGLPRTKYFTEGPLDGVFERFPPPSPMADAVQRAVDEPSWDNSWILWPVLSYSVWYHTWFQADDVGRRPDMVVYESGSEQPSSPEPTIPG